MLLHIKDATLAIIRVDLIMNLSMDRTVIQIFHASKFLNKMLLHKRAKKVFRHTSGPFLSG